MSGVTHTAAGAIIGYWIGNPGLGFVAGLGSHLVMDLIPHREFFPWKQELLGVLVLASLFVGFTSGGRVATLVAILGAAGPDIEIVLWKMGILEKGQLLFPTHTPLLPQRESHRRSLALIQILIILAGFLVVFGLRYYPLPVNF